MTAEVISFDNYLRRKRATGKALADEARAEALLPAEASANMLPQIWESLAQIRRRQDQLTGPELVTRVNQEIQRRRDKLNQPEIVSHKTWEQVYRSMDDLALRLAILRVQRGPNRLDE